MEWLTETELNAITRREIAKYDGVSPHASIYLFEDENRRAYAISGIEHTPGENRAWIILQARILDGVVVIDVDNLMDKNLWEALMKAGIPREQLVLAYQGEKIPEPNRT